MDTKKTSEPKKSPDLQGEGNYDATKKYDNGLTDYLKKGTSDEAAEKARRAIDGPEGEELRLAEQEAKKGPMPKRAKPTAKPNGKSR